MGKFALIGEKLGHSFSPQIHSMLSDYEYTLKELAPDELESFLKTTELDGMNVTIPYKKAVLPYCAHVDEAVGRIGSANTLVKREDGWYAYNTDYCGFIYMLTSCGYSPKGKKAVVLGNGGASVAVVTALEDMGAAEIVVISRKGENNYGNLHLHADADVVVNATPVGMYPKTGVAAVSLDAFPKCRAVFDLIYNPSRTKLILDAEARGLICRSGLSMLVAQAHAAAEYFTGSSIDKGRIEDILHTLERETGNIILIGMPGCGKSTVGKLLADELQKTFVDADEELVKTYGMDIPAIFANQGEAGFREKETSILEALGKRSGLIIATGGGCVTREENYPLLHQNGKLFWIQRELDQLPTDGRPLSQIIKMEDMYRIRKPLYEHFADYTIRNNQTAEAAAAEILAILEGNP